MEEFLKIYGSVIGPTLAFILGAIALFIKYFIDEHTKEWSLSKKIDRLEKLIIQSGPASTYHPQKSEKAIHADEARNLTNLARFYSRLIALKIVFSSLGDDIADHGAIDQITKYNILKWKFDYILKDVEQMRSKENFRMSHQDFHELRTSWENLQKALTAPEEFTYYVERKTPNHHA